MIISSLNSPMISEINWIYTLVLHAIKPNENGIDITPPDLPEDISYATFLRNVQPTMYERLVMALAHSFQLAPGFFKKLYIEESQNDTGIDSFGLLQHAGTNLVQPTIHTANWLADMYQIETQFLDEHHYLFSDMILEPLTFEPSVFCSPLVFTKKAQYLFYGSREYTPEYSADFPAELLTTSLTKKDLILPRTTLNEVDELIYWIQHRAVFQEDKHLQKWIRPGFRGLFYGPPGTGKSLTATLIGQETNVPVYRIDLSNMISKYIGETQKNLAKVFDSAERNQWILFFDECDAILGSRSNNGSTNERGANQEIAYLLQRIESYQGIILLATNLKENIDAAFLRRFEVSIEFDMPDVATRTQLWKAIFSDQYQIEEAWIKNLAKSYKLTGGALVNILRFVALQKQQNTDKITLYVLLEGIRREYHKIGQTMPPYKDR
ncbi:MAG: ATP-binding protein [Bacteroidota bacterium]